MNIRAILDENDYGEMIDAYPDDEGRIKQIEHVLKEVKE